MEHSKKMILIDPRVLDSLRSSPTPNPLTTSLQDLDHQMKDILDRHDLPVEDKANAYQQTLKRYLHRLDQVKQQPLGVVSIQNSTSPSFTSPTEKKEEVTNPSSSSDKVAERILDSVSKSYKKKTQMILQHIQDNPDLSWNERGEFIWQGRRIENSNMMDLINDLMRKRKNFDSPHGWKTFASALKTSNVPRELVGNPSRWNYMFHSNTPTLATPSHSTLTTQSTPPTIKSTDGQATPSVKKSQLEPKVLKWEHL